MHRATRSCMLAATTAGPTKRATVRTLRRKKSCRSITRCSVHGSSSSRPLKRSQLSTSTGFFSCLKPRRMARSRSVVRSCGLSNSGDPKKIPLPEERRRALSGRPLTPPSPPRDRSKRTSRAGDLQSPCPSRPGRNGPRTLRPTPPK